MYLVGAGIFAIAIGGLLYSRCGKDEPKKDPVPVAAATSAAPEPQPALPEYAPPPPPEEEPKGEGGKEGGDEDKKTAEPGPKKAAAGGPVSKGVCSQCGKGVPSGALKTAVSQTMGLARGCYNRALRGGAGEGRIVVSVSVGADGTLCGASLASNTTGNAALGSCVLSKFSGRSYPPPQSGCVVVNAPINFSTKQ